MKKIIVIFLSLFIVTGCTSGHMYSYNEIVDYAKETYSSDVVVLDNNKDLNDNKNVWEAYLSSNKDIKFNIINYYHSGSSDSLPFDTYSVCSDFHNVVGSYYFNEYKATHDVYYINFEEGYVNLNGCADVPTFILYNDSDTLKKELDDIISYIKSNNINFRCLVKYNYTSE